MKRSVNTKIMEAVCHHFSKEEITRAKDCPSEAYGEKFTCVMKNRRYTTSKLKNEIVVEDLLRIMSELDRKGVKTKMCSKKPCSTTKVRSQE